VFIGICVERTCLAQVYSQGYQIEDIKALYLYTCWICNTNSWHI